MIKTIILLCLIVSMLTGCSKDKTEPLLTVEVYDYISGQPIQGVEVGRTTMSNWSFQCLCYTNTNVSTLGYTGADGKLNGLLTFDFIFVQKDKYLTAEKNKRCLSSGNDYNYRFDLFRHGMFEIFPRPSRAYTDPIWLEIYPMLKTGLIPKPFYADQFWITDTTRIRSFGYAGLVNRLLILKRSTSSIPDTLHKSDIFLPENTEKQVILNY